MKSWLSWFRAAKAKSKTVIEYLPDADEIERSPVPPYAQLTLQLMLVGFVVAITWAIFSKVDLVVTAQGRLINPLPNVVVQPLETAVIKSVDVRIGQVVKVGDTLATLDATFVQADESQLKNRLSSLETQISGLEQELSGQTPPRDTPTDTDGQLQATLLAERQANYRAQQARLNETQAKLRASLLTNRQDQQLVASRLKSLREIESMQEKMVTQKFAAPLQLLEAQQRTKEVQRELELTVNREQEIKREIAAFDAEKLAFERNWRQKAMEEMLSVTRERDSLKEQLQKADRRQKLVTLTTPIDAVVLEIAKLSPGSVVREAETFFTLVPLKGKLEAEVQIDSADIGYIKVSDPVRLKLDAYPFQRHGTLPARIRSLSEDAFKRDSASKSALTDAYFNARLDLLDGELKNMKPTARLLPGMTLSAEIVVGQRSVLSYLAWPLTKGLSEALREP